MTLTEKKKKNKNKKTLHHHHYPVSTNGTKTIPTIFAPW